MTFNLNLDGDIIGFVRLGNDLSWFIPSSGSMEIIYSNVHSLGLGNFNENLIYWSSTKEGYFPYVMAFNFESWGGLPFPGSCLDVNGLLIARKIN